MILIAPSVNFVLKPALATALRPVCYFIYYWTGLIISPEAFVVGVMLLSVLLLVLQLAVRRFLDGASSGQP